MISKLLFPALLILILVINSCNKNNNPVSENDNILGIYGQVVGARGIPIDGVNIHYIPELIYYQESISAIKKTTPSTQIMYEVYHDSAIVYLYILRYFTEDTVAVMLDGVPMNKGTHTINFNNYKFTTGVYNYIIKYDTTLIKKNLFIYKLSGELVTSDPIIKTDIHGNFFLSYKELALGLSFDRYDPSPDPGPNKILISNNISLFMTKDGYENNLVPMTIAINTATVKTFILKK